MPSQRALPASAPARGAFPLDHHGQCTQFKHVRHPHDMDFMVCMAENDNIYHRCKEQSKVYLKCRMDRNLMAKEDLATMGFARDAKVVAAKDPGDVTSPDRPALKKRIAGMSHLGAMKKRWAWLGFGTSDDKGSAKGGGAET